VLQDGWLKTGDLGRLDADGVLWLSGRRSDMIKTGAHRVHPLDVEEAIAELPGVVEVAVVGIDDALLGQVIKACIVRADTLDENAVRAHCRARLAGYKIPKLVEFVDALPKTASGKIKRAELAAAAASKGAS
jgi:acyl-CoA synthetase (AMP-forming)/AMP-acid ligase II